MSKNNTGMSGGVNNGGITIGSNKGNVNTTQDEQNQGGTTIQNTGGIGNLATGPNHSGPMTATMGSPGQKKALEDVTEDDVVEILKEKKLGNFEGMFREQGIDGSLLQILTDERLSTFGVTDDWDRKRILNLKKHLPK